MKKLLLFFLLFVLNCSLVHAQNWVWGKEGNNSADIWNVATDYKGNAYQTGAFYYSISFGADTLNSAPSATDVYLVKYDSNGNVLWAKQSATPANTSYGEGFSITTDPAGDIYITGGFIDTIVFGSDTLFGINNYSNCFLVKYDFNGNVLWAKQSFAPSDASYGLGGAVAADASGNVYITGSFTDTISFGSDTLIDYLNPKYSIDVFLVKYDSNGNLLWANQSKSPNYNVFSSGIGNAVSTDALNNAYITGDFSDTLSFGVDTLIANSVNGFLVKYDSNGHVLWARQVNGGGTSLSTDVYNNIYVGGTSIIKFNASGNVLWTKQPNSNNVVLYSLASDNYGHIFFSGSISKSNIIFCDDTLYEPTGSVDPAIVMELDTSGNALCASITRTGGDDQNAIACDKSGRYVYFGGDIADTITFGKDFLITEGGTSEPPFVARWQPCPDVVDTVQQPEASGPCGDIFIPDAFSPNGDGQNDVLYVRCNCLSIMDFIVFDRWGNKVFESNDINDGWDGTYKGKNENTGTYVYYMKGTYTDGSSFEKKGSVALVR